MSAVRIVANHAVCVGSGQCVFADPDTFDQEDSGTVLILRDRPTRAEELAAAKQAVAICPSRALSIVED